MSVKALRAKGWPKALTTQLCARPEEGEREQKCFRQGGTHFSSIVLSCSQVHCCIFYKWFTLWKFILVILAVLVFLTSQIAALPPRERCCKKCNNFCYSEFKRDKCKYKGALLLSKQQQSQGWLRRALPHTRGCCEWAQLGSAAIGLFRTTQLLVHSHSPHFSICSAVCQ